MTTPAFADVQAGDDAAGQAHGGNQPADFDARIRADVGEAGGLLGDLREDALERLLGAMAEDVDEEHVVAEAAAGLGPRFRAASG